MGAMCTHMVEEEGVARRGREGWWWLRERVEAGGSISPPLLKRAKRCGQARPEAVTTRCFWPTAFSGGDHLLFSTYSLSSVPEAGASG